MTCLPKGESACVGGIEMAGLCYMSDIDNAAVALSVELCGEHEPHRWLNSLVWNSEKGSGAVRLECEDCHKVVYIPVL